MNSKENDWKLKLRYGLLKTPFKHFTLIAKGYVEEPIEDFSCPVGNAYMGMKVWALDSNEAYDVIKSVGNHIGFKITGNTEIFETDPVQPPSENPFGYDINFTPFQDE